MSRYIDWLLVSLALAVVIGLVVFAERFPGDGPLFPMEQIRVITCC